MLILRLKIALILWLQGRSVDYTWSSHWRIVLTEQYTYMCVFMQLFVLFVLCFGAVFWCCVLVLCFGAVFYAVLCAVLNTADGGTGGWRWAAGRSGTHCINKTLIFLF